MDILFTPEAEIEITEAYRWYNERSVKLGTRFLAAVEAATLNAASAPLQYPVWQRGTRRILLHKFPYGLFYIIQQNQMVIFACFHGRRNPKTLLARTPSS